MPVIGFTGTREDLQEPQRRMLHKVLRELDANTMHHGDCIGADATAHTIAYALGYDIVIHPPTNQTKRAFCGQGETGVKILEPRPYLARNKDIVIASDVLVACSRTMKEIQRSGTWWTIGYALNHMLLNSRVSIIYPDGSIEERTT